MNTLQNTRALIKTQLSSLDFPVFDFKPERANPPVAWVEPGDPYMSELASEDQSLGYGFEFEVRHNLWLATRTKTNELETNEVDQMICEAIIELDAFKIESVGWSVVTLNGQEYLGARLVIATTQELTA